MLESFGCIILYNSKHKKASVSYPFYSSMVDLATTCDALVCACLVAGVLCCLGFEN